MATRVSFSCEGNHTVASDGALLCQGTWIAESVPAPFDWKTISPDQKTELAGFFLVGFITVAGVWFTGFVLKLVLSPLRRKHS